MPAYSDGNQIKPGHVVEYNKELYVVTDKRDVYLDFFITNIETNKKTHPNSEDLTFVAKCRTIDHLMVGDYILDGYGYKRKVLGRAGEVFFTSWSSDNGENHDKKAGSFFTIFQLKAYGYILLHEDEDEQNDTIEITLKKVAEKIGVAVEKLRIKDEE